MFALKKYLLELILCSGLLFLFSCNETGENIVTDYPLQLDGKWVIDESLSTNGPVCYFLDKGNLVEFDVIISDKGLYFSYFTGSLNRRDFFSYKIINKTLYCSGEYSTNQLDENTPAVLLPQYLDIEFVEYSKIHCKLRLAVKDERTGEINVGDVSNFFAIKSN